MLAIVSQAFCPFRMAVSRLFPGGGPGPFSYPYPTPPKSLGKPSKVLWNYLTELRGRTSFMPAQFGPLEKCLMQTAGNLNRPRSEQRCYAHLHSGVKPDSAFFAVGFPPRRHIFNFWCSHRCSGFGLSMAVCSLSCALWPSYALT